MSTDGPPSFNISRPYKVAWFLLLSLFSLLYVLRWDEAPIGAVTDDAYYVEMARSISEGLGPVLAIGPEQAPMAPDIFPPGFPLLLSPLARIFPHSLTALKIVPLLGMLLLIPLSWSLPGAGADNRLRFAVLAVVALNPWAISWSGRLLSDIPYTALSLGALLVFVKMRSGHLSHWTATLGLVLLCAAAVSVRTIGWALILAMVVSLLLNRRWWQAAGLPLTVLLLNLPTWLASGSGTGFISEAYARQMFAGREVPLWRFALENGLGYVAELPVLLVPLFGQPVQSVMQQWHTGVLYPAVAFVVGTALILLIGLAIKRRWKHETDGELIRLCAGYLVFYGAALVQFNGYPSGVQTRLLLPLLPILVWLVLIGMQELFGQRRPRIPLLVWSLMILAALSHNVWRVARPLRTSVDASGHGLVDPSRGADWIHAHTPPTAVIMTIDGLIRHIHFRRPVVEIPVPCTTESLAQKLSAYEVDFIFVGPSVHHRPGQLDATGNNLLALVRNQPAFFEPVWSDTMRNITVFSCRGRSSSPPN